MKYLTYKDQMISQVCFGCEALGGTDCGDFNLDQLSFSVHKSIEFGLNFFDTSNVYGLGASEINLSNILGSKRKDMIIATKGGLSWNEYLLHGRAKIIKDSSVLALEKNLNSSLVRLNIDCIPLYYIHWPDVHTDLSITFGCLKDFQEKGKIRMIGCSNFNLDQLKKAYEIVHIDFLQVSYNLFEPISLDLVDFCNKKNINIIAYNVLCHGILSGKFTSLPKFKENDRRSRLLIFQKENFDKVNDKVNELKKISNLQNSSLLNYVLKQYLNSNCINYFILGLKTEKQVIESLSF